MRFSSQQEFIVHEENMEITLYRPVGQAELDFIVESGYTAFPPRLPEQQYWIPASELEEFNWHIMGKIRVVARFTDQRK